MFWTKASSDDSVIVLAFMNRSCVDYSCRRAIGYSNLGFDHAALFEPFHESKTRELVGAALTRFPLSTVAVFHTVVAQS